MIQLTYFKHRMKNIKSSYLLFGILSILILTIILIGCNTFNKGKQISTPQLSVGIQNSPSNALVIIADKKGFFDTTKVKVVVKEFTAGKLALQALLGQAGDLDVAVSAETPVALSSLGGNKIKVISQIVSAKDEARVVVRKDGNLDTPEKYFNKKRKLTTSLGGSPEWFTYNFIKKYNLDKNKLEVIAMLPENMPVALSGGAVDAISIFDPYARIGEKELGDKGLTFYDSDVTSYYVMSVKDATIKEKGVALEELIKGLLKAEEFIKTNPDEAKKIVADQTKLDIGIINETWSNYSFDVRLDKSFIELSKSEANWAIETGKYPQGTAIPNFNSVIDSTILKKIAPNSVNQ